ncbi:hypothetical protein [Longimicrobium sp.]
MELFKKSPLDLGLRPEELDPAWEEAMMVLKAATEDEQRMMRE